MKDFREFKTEIGGKEVTVEIGKYAFQTNGHCIVRCGDTVVMCNTCMNKEPRPGQDFFPLSVDFEEKLYFQKDMRDVKSYQDVPFMVKVKSDRGLKRALELIDALSEKEKIEKKARYFPVDSIENLKNLKK